VEVHESIAASAELHSTVMSGDTMQMQHTMSWPVPAGGALELVPGAKHIMLLDLPVGLAAGHNFELTLNFEQAGPQTVTVEVRTIAESVR
jgi:copper(I)-binding protein